MSGSAVGSQSIATALRQAAVRGLTAVLRAEVSGDVGYLFLRKGEVVHAATLDLEGEAAATEIWGWGEAALDWCERRWPEARSVPPGWARTVEERPPVVRADAAAAAPTPARAERNVEPAESSYQPLLATPAAVHYPSTFGVRRVLAHADFENVLCITTRGEVGESRGKSEHLAPIVHAGTTLGDSLGQVLGLGPLIAAEAKAKGWHLLIARSSEDTSAIESSGGEGVDLARAFLKL